MFSFLFYDLSTPSHQAGELTNKSFLGRVLGDREVLYLRCQSGKGPKTCWSQLKNIVDPSL